MVKAFVCVVVLLPLICSGQSSKIEAGISVPLFFKVNTDFTSQLKNTITCASGIDFAIKVNGQDENSMSFLLLIGLLNDKRSFQMEPGSEISTGLFYLNINPSVLIRSKWDNLKFNIGIGGLINVGQNFSSSTSTPSSRVSYTNVDTNYQIINSNSRLLIPYISLGVLCDIRKHIKAQLLVEPTLQNYYEPGTKIAYQINYNRKEFSVGYQPVYFGLRLFYFF
jgi:hypothetical protein